MSVPERISLETLTAVYALLDMHPSPTHPLSFERADELMVFHDATPDDQFFLVYVVRDINQATAGQGVDESLHEQFLNALFDMHEST